MPLKMNKNILLTMSTTSRCLFLKTISRSRPVNSIKHLWVSEFSTLNT